MIYDPGVDIFALRLPGDLADTEERFEDVFLEYDEEGNLIGVEISLASQTYNKVRKKIEDTIPELKGKLPEDLKDLRLKTKGKKASISV
jgi:uncharacterized protein YuzE